MKEELGSWIMINKHFHGLINNNTSRKIVDDFFYLANLEKNILNEENSKTLTFLMTNFLTEINNLESALKINVEKLGSENCKIIQELKALYFMRTTFVDLINKNISRNMEGLLIVDNIIALAYFLKTFLNDDLMIKLIISIFKFKKTMLEWTLRNILQYLNKKRPELESWSILKTTFDKLIEQTCVDDEDLLIISNFIALANFEKNKKEIILPKESLKLMKS